MILWPFFGQTSLIYKPGQMTLSPFSKKLQFLIMILVALLLTIFLFIPLVARGMEITPDGVDYLKTASNVVKGYGFSLGCPPKVHPNLHWPPGYSALIAAFLFVHVSWINACK